MARLFFTFTILYIFVSVCNCKVENLKTIGDQIAKEAEIYKEQLEKSSEFFEQRRSVVKKLEETKFGCELIIKIIKEILWLDISSDEAYNKKFLPIAFEIRDLNDTITNMFVEAKQMMLGDDESAESYMDSVLTQHRKLAALYAKFTTVAKDSGPDGSRTEELLKSATHIITSLTQEQNDILLEQRSIEAAEKDIAKRFYPTFEKAHDLIREFSVKWGQREELYSTDSTKDEL